VFFKEFLSKNACLWKALHSFLDLDVDESSTCCLVVEFVEFDIFCGQSLDFHAHEFGVRHGCHKIKKGQWCSSGLLLLR
jgi:hypothetical protein